MLAIAPVVVGDWRLVAKDETISNRRMGKIVRANSCGLPQLG